MPKFPGSAGCEISGFAETWKRGAIMALSADLLRQLISGLGDLYSPVGSADYPARVVTVVTSVLRCDSCSYNQFGPAGPLAWHVQPAGVGAFPDSVGIFQQNLPQHPVLNHQQATGNGQAMRISDFLSDRQFRALGLYRDFYRHTDTRYQAAISVPGPRKGLIGIAVNRPYRDFTDDEIELLDLLRPHIQQAAMICQALGEPVRAPSASPGEHNPLITARQARIMQLVAAGHPDKVIGRNLGISTRTVNAHLQNIYRTLDVTSRTEALARLAAATPPQPREP
jgi:DNA-binding CsgD family transcriptional regulator